MWYKYKSVLFNPVKPSGKANYVWYQVSQCLISITTCQILKGGDEERGRDGGLGNQNGYKKNNNQDALRFKTLVKAARWVIKRI